MLLTHLHFYIIIISIHLQDSDHPAELKLCTVHPTFTHIPISNPLNTDTLGLLRKANTSEHILGMMSVGSEDRAEYYSACLAYMRS